MKRFVILLLPSLLSLEAAARVASLQIGATPRTTLSPLEMAAGIVLIACLFLSIWAVLTANKARRIAAMLRRDVKELKMQTDFSQAYGRQGGANDSKNEKGVAKPNAQLSLMVNDMSKIFGRLDSIERWTVDAACEINKISSRMDHLDYHDPAPSPEIDLAITPNETILYAQLDASDPKRLFNVSNVYNPSKHIYKIILKGEEQTGDLEIIEENASKVFSNSDCSRCCNFRVTPEPNNFKQTPGKARVNGDTAEVLKEIEVSSK